MTLNILWWVAFFVFGLALQQAFELADHLLNDVGLDGQHHKVGLCRLPELFQTADAEILLKRARLLRVGVVGRHLLPLEGAGFQQPSGNGIGHVAHADKGKSHKKSSLLDFEKTSALQRDVAAKVSIARRGGLRNVQGGRGGVFGKRE